MTTFNSSRFTELAGLLLEDSSRKYLEKINFDSLIKAAGKPTGDPKSFYREIQSKSKSGPIFSEKVIGFVDNLPQELQKNEAKWLANLLQKDDSLGAFNLASSSISNIIDWVRAENPNLENYNLQMA